MFSRLFRVLVTFSTLFSGILVCQDTTSSILHREGLFGKFFSVLPSSSFLPSSHYLGLLLGMLVLGLLIQLAPWTTSFDLGICSQSFFVLGLLERVVVAGTTLMATLAAGSSMHLMAYFINLKAVVENLSPYHAAFFSTVCILCVGCATYFFLADTRSQFQEKEKDLLGSLIALFFKTFLQIGSVFLFLIPMTKGLMIDIFSQSLLSYWPLYIVLGLGTLLPSFSKSIFMGEAVSGTVWDSFSRWGQALSGWIFLIGAIFFARAFAETVYFPSTVWSLCLASYLVSFCLFCAREFSHRIVSWVWIMMAFLVVVAFFILERHELCVQNIGFHPVQEQLGLVFP
ncbi:hypothetical protein [Candidatus Similichlamydia laticola]|uniref:Uncharacterized protein n=1 Tax=Candidatus Similichlamydia laticola TaxID=2170265 RepID=A0A369KIY5_9BACT|nr:hypothetical protein [Candidatus Similichlamydia laticola]RDB31743.1 hypothetical protein HAT2_00123 [Candidatus Similichlamydia laticola]